MVSSVALRAGELLIAALVGGGVLVAVAFAGALWLRRMIRRRLEALGLVLAGRARGAAAAAVSAGWRWTWSLRVPDRRWIAVGRARRRLWRAVSSAEHAVAMARRGAVPTGELDALCRQLRRAAASLDRSLAVERHTTAADGGLESVSAQATELVSAAKTDPGRRCCRAWLLGAAGGQRTGRRCAPRGRGARRRHGQRCPRRSTGWTTGGAGVNPATGAGRFFGRPGTWPTPPDRRPAHCRNAARGPCNCQPRRNRASRCRGG
jgi:hypothetical protein